MTNVVDRKNKLMDDNLNRMISLKKIGLFARLTSGFLERYRTVFEIMLTTNEE